MSNLLVNHNPTFDPSVGEGIWQHPDYNNIFVPDGWTLGWLDQQPFEGIALDPPGLVAHRPEAVIITEWSSLPPELTPDDSYTWKVFVRNPLYCWIALEQPVNLPAGSYTLQFKVWPKLHLLDTGNPQPQDPWAGEVGLQLQGLDIAWKSSLDYAHYNTLEWTFQHPGGTLAIALYMKGKYPIDNTFFCHWVSIPTGDEPQPPLPGGTVELGPITLTYLERVAAALESIADRFNAGGPVPPEPEPEPEPIAWSQNDPRWKDSIYSGGMTFGQGGCLVCSYATIASLVVNPPPTPPEFAAALRSVGAFDGALLSNPQRIPQAYAALQWGGVAHWRTIPADLGLLQTELDRGRATVCEVKWDPNGPAPQQGNQHFVVVTELVYDAQQRVTDALILDPWDGQEKLLLATRYVKPGWTVAQALYGIRMLQPLGAPVPPEPNPAALRGVHGAPTYNPPYPVVPWVERLLALGIRWYKLLDDGTRQNDALISALKSCSIEPIVRLYQGGQFPNRLAAPLRARLPQLAQLGVRYVEIGNEPNLAGEWSTGTPDWHNSEQVTQLAHNWWLDAQEALAVGLSPALYALAPTERNYGTHPTASSIQWQRALLSTLWLNTSAQLFPLLSGGRVWLAVHSADFGLPFTYPYQLESGAIDDMCLLGYKAHLEIARQTFGVRPLAISTEGGVYSPEHLAQLTFPVTYDESMWGSRLRTMYAFLAQEGDLLAMCPWTFSDEGAPDEWQNCGWYREDGTPRSPVAALTVG